MSFASSNPQRRGGRTRSPGTLGGTQGIPAFLGWLPVILGVVLGLIAMQQSGGRGMAMAGLVCSGVALALKVMFWMAIFSFFGAWRLHHHYW